MIDKWRITFSGRKRAWWTLWLLSKWCVEWEEHRGGWSGKGGGFVTLREWCSTEAELLNYIKENFRES